MSLRYTISVAIFDRQAYLEKFTPESIVEPRTVALAHRVEIEIDDEIDRAYPETYGDLVTVVTRSGQMMTRRVDYSPGMPEIPMPHAEIERKFTSLASGSVGPEFTQNILALANGLFAAKSVAPLSAAFDHIEHF